MYNKHNILIPETLFDCIKNSRGLDCFIPISKHSVGARRQQRSRTPEQKADFKILMSKVMKKVRKKYFESITPERKAELSELMGQGMSRYWANVSREDKKTHIETIRVGMQKACDEGRNGTRKEIVERLHKADSIENDLPRINTYSGVITMSEMESL